MEERTGLILICTGKYDIFLQPLIDSADKYFLPNHARDVYILADKVYKINRPRDVSITWLWVPHMKFPYPTLFRYKWMTQYAQHLTAKYLYYCDVDMLFVNNVGDEILPDETGLVAVKHPGFNHGGWGDHKTPERSRAWVNDKQGYCAGGFQGGSHDAYLTAAKTMAENIDADLEQGVMAEFHDESHWNRYLKSHGHKVLSSEYCMVEEIELRKKWGINNLVPRILALKKDHKELRA